MRTIEERAKEYARMTESDHPHIVAHDYASGAIEELNRIYKQLE